MTAKVRNEVTEFGFNFGAAEIRRSCHDDAKGWVVFDVVTPRQRLQVYVTRTGKIRVHDKDGKEWGAK